MLRVSIHSELGRTLSQRYNANVTPTFIIFDGEGREVWRGSVLPSAERVIGAG